MAISLFADDEYDEARQPSALILEACEEHDNEHATRIQGCGWCELERVALLLEEEHVAVDSSGVYYYR